MNTELYFSTLAILFVVMDPAANVPVYLGLTSRLGEAGRKKAAFTAAITSFLIIVAFAVGGRYILGFLHISQEALQFSGGVLLFLVAMELLMGKDQEKDVVADNAAHNVALVPLATPLLAGPGAIVAVMVQVDKAGGTIPGLVGVALAVITIHLLIWLAMRFASVLAHYLRESGVLILTKIAGVLLAAIATEMTLNGLFSYIHKFY